MMSSETSLKKIPFSIFIFLIVFLLLPIGCNKPISKEKADQIAKATLEEYCKNQNIEITRFGKPNISADTKYPWIYEFVSRGSPKHTFLIYIDRYGNIERHRMIE
jgi:hypothetical protein